MTTVLFDGEYLIADSRVICGDKVVTDSRAKIVQCNWSYIDMDFKQEWNIVAFACAGYSQLIDEFSSEFKDKEKVTGISVAKFLHEQHIRYKNKPHMFIAVAVTSCGRYIMLGTHRHGTPKKVYCSWDWVAIGSGSVHVTGEEHNIFEAAQKAKSKDNWTGGDLRFLNCRTGETGICSDKESFALIA